MVRLMPREFTQVIFPSFIFYQAQYSFRRPIFFLIGGNFHHVPFLKAFRLHRHSSLRNRAFVKTIGDTISLESCFQRLKAPFSAVLDSTCHWKGYLTSGRETPASRPR